MTDSDRGELVEGRNRSSLALQLSSVGDFHHLHFLAAMVSSIHVKCLSVVVHNLPDGAMRHVSSSRFSVLPRQSDGLSIRASRAFHHKDPGAHGTHPGRYIALEKVVVAGYLKSGEGLSHHLAGEVLLEEAPVQQYLHFSGTGRLHGRLVGFHPFPGFGCPASCEAGE